MSNKDAKILLIIKNCSIELVQRIQEVINEYNEAKKHGLKLHEK